MTTIRPTYDPTNMGNQPGNGPLRVGGQSVSGLPQSEADLPSTPSKCVKAMAPALQIVRDCWIGTSQIRAKAQAYLPQAPGEQPLAYQARLARSVFTNIYRNTIEGLVGYVFRTDPSLGEDIPPAIQDHWENIDLAGTHGDVFMRDRLVDVMIAGHGAILVDYPQTGGDQTRADELMMDIRPYWVPIQKDQILSWRTENEGGHTVLTQVVIKECTYEPVGEFGDQEVTRYRVFTREAGLVSYRLLQIGSDQKTVITVEEGTYPTQQEIPIAEIRTSGSTGIFESEPPLLDLAFLNISHYQQWSDYATSIHKTCVPIWVETGVTMQPDGSPETVILGPNTCRQFTNPQATASYQSHSGAALASCKQALDDLKNDMAQLGLAALQSSKRVAETARAKELDKSASDSALAVTARALQDAVERALDFHARYLGLDEGGSVEINRDYQNEILDAPTMTAYVALSTQLGLPLRVILEALQEGGRIPESYDLDQLEQEMMANQAAIEAQKQQQQADQLAALQAKQGTPTPDKTTPPMPGMP